MMLSTARIAARQARCSNIAALRAASTWAKVPQGPPVSQDVLKAILVPNLPPLTQ